MYVFYDSTGRIINCAVAPEEIDGFTAPQCQTALFLDDNKYADVAAQWQNYVIQNGVPTLSPPAPSIEEALTAQLTNIQAGYNATIAAGFTSNATGTLDTYAIDETAYPKWTGILSTIAAGIAPNSITVKDISGNQVTLTQSQFKQFALDGFNFLNAQEQQLWTLQNQIKAATTVEAVQSVTWTPGAYTPQPAPAAPSSDTNSSTPTT